MAELRGIREILAAREYGRGITLGPNAGSIAAAIAVGGCCQGARRAHSD